MVGAMILERAIPLWQGVSPDLQQAVQEQVQEEVRRRGFAFGGQPPWASPAATLGILVPISFLAMIVLIIFVAARRRQAELRARAEFQKQILDKFSSGKEFADFLGTEASQRFLTALSSPALGAHYRALGMMRGGITIAVFGIGFLLLTALRRGFVVPGVLLVALGTGLLIAAAASYHFSKKWSGNGPATPGQAL